MATGQNKKCPGCDKTVETFSGSETWHNECYVQHHREEPVCLKHKVCRAN